MAIKKLGIVKVTSGKLIVGDPCYDDSMDYEKLAAVNGDWKAQVSISNSKGFNEGRVVSLTLAHSSVHPDQSKQRLATLGVDSGQMSAFDAKSYRKDELAKGMKTPKWLTAKRLREEPKGEMFYGACCALTCSDESEGLKGGNFKEVGVVCESGWGDGSYSLYIWKKGNKVVKVQVKFL